MSTNRTLLSATLLLHFAAISLVYGQIRSGTIAGSVQDATGAVVGSATVSILNEETNITASVKTTESGEFTFPYLPAGRYTVTVSITGFAVFRESGVNLETAQTIRVDAKLEVSSVETTVAVEARAATIQTGSTSVSGAAESQVIDSIPNVTQNPLYYAMLQNRVQPRNETANSTSLSSFGIGVAGRAQFSAIGVNGGRAFTNDIQLDGLPIMGGGFNEAAILPNTEGLQEVRVISNNFTADYGHGQSVISFSTKSGTNQYHGQADYMLRNEALNAHTDTNKANGFARSPFKVNQFGGAVAGPIMRNKLFFSSSYHFLRFSQGQNYLQTVPTDLERQGNFSQTMLSNAGAFVPVQVFNRFSVTQLATDLYQRAPFPNAIIPNPNPYAVHIYSFYPEPNRTPDDPTNVNNYASSKVNTERQHRLNNRIDFKNGRHSIYGSSGFDYGDIAQPRAFGTAGFNDVPTITKDRNPYGQIGDTVVISPTLLLDIRYGATRIIALNLGGNRTGFTDCASFGIPASTQALFASYGSAPIVLPNNFSGGSGGGSNWSGLSSGQFVNKQEHQLSHALNASITKIRGNWTHRAGVELRILHSNYQDMEEASAEIASCCANVGSNFTFQNVTASGASASTNTSPLQAGVNVAALLVGENVWWVRPGETVWPALAAKYFAVYSQNDWKLTPRLTLNLGLRWELQPGPSEPYNQISAYDFTQKNAFGTLSAIHFSGANGNSRNLWATEYHDFDPRVGAAYRFGSNLVLRGGLGISYLPSNTGYFSSPNEYGEESFSPGTQMIPYGTTPNGLPATTFSDLAPVAQATGSNASAPQIYGGSNALFTNHLKNGIAKQGNAFLEKSFGSRGQLLAAVGYSFCYSNNLANRNWPLQSLQNIPSATLSAWLTQYVASNGATNPANVQVQNPWQPATGPLLPFTGTLAGRTNFQMQRISDFYYGWCAAAADINRDGVMDVIDGPCYYLGPDYTERHEFTSARTYNPSNQFSQDIVNFGYDFTGDGWPDTLMVDQRPIYLYVNPRGESRRWDRYNVVPQASTEIELLKDVDGDGKPAVLFGGDGAMEYAKPDPANPTAPWIVHRFSERIGVNAHGMGVGDINGDGRLDIVNNRGWWEHPPAGSTQEPWTFHPANFGSGGAEMGVYDVKGDGLNDGVTSLSAHGWGLAWFEQKRDAEGKISFVQHDTMGDFSTRNAGNVAFSELYGVTFADLHGDGVPDVIVGRRHWSHLESYTDPDPYGRAVLYWYRTVCKPNAEGGAEFILELIHNRSGVGSHLAAVDLNQDGAVDIITSTNRGTFIFWNKMRQQKRPAGNQ